MGPGDGSFIDVTLVVCSTTQAETSQGTATDPVGFVSQAVWRRWLSCDASIRPKSWLMAGPMRNECAIAEGLSLNGPLILFSPLIPLHADEPNLRDHPRVGFCKTYVSILDLEANLSTQT